MERLMAAMFLMERHFGINSFSNNTWFSKTTDYAINIMLPSAYWNNNMQCINFADTDFGLHAGMDHNLRLLASKYNKPAAQHLADLLVEKGYGTKSLAWLSLIWNDDSIGACSLVGAA